MAAMAIAGAAIVRADSGAAQALRIRLLGRERGMTPDAAWRAALEEARALEESAARQGAWPLAIEVAGMRAYALAWVAQDYPAALALLQQARSRYLSQAPGNARSLFLAEAEIRSRLGDEIGIRKLITEFRSSPAYDGAPLRYQLGEGRDTPMVIERPRAAVAESSITLAAMQRLQMRARAAPGAWFPPFEMTDAFGRRISSAALAGKPVCILFFASRSPLWERLAQAIARWERSYGGRFYLLLVSLDLDDEGVRTLSQRYPLTSARWFSRNAGAATAMRVGVFGDPEGFVLDAEGRIRYRGTDESELAAAMRVVSASR